MKNFFLAGNLTGILGHTSQALFQLSYSNIVTQSMENYLFNLRISKTKPQTLDQSWLKFLLFSSICLISSSKGMQVKKNYFLSGNRTGVHFHASQALYQLNYCKIDTQNLENDLFNLRILVTQHFRFSKTRPQTLDQSWSCFYLL